MRARQIAIAVAALWKKSRLEEAAAIEEMKKDMLIGLELR